MRGHVYSPWLSACDFLQQHHRGVIRVHSVSESAKVTPNVPDSNPTRDTSYWVFASRISYFERFYLSNFTVRLELKTSPAPEPPKSIENQYTSSRFAGRFLNFKNIK